MIRLAQLLVTQNGLRHHADLSGMIDFVRSGGLWTAEALNEFARQRNFRPSPLIQVSRFEDDALYLHDGHHRAVATVLGGRTYLDACEYVVTTWTYEQYREFNPEAGWFTPFDPRTHCRRADLSGFKKHMRHALAAQQAELLKSPDLYLEARQFGSVIDLATELGGKIRVDR